MNKNKLVIIFVIFLSFLLLGQWCYYSFCSPNKDEKVEETEGFFTSKYGVKDVPEIARKDFFLFCQQLDDYKQKAITEKKIRQEDLEKSIETLKDQGIWDGIRVEPGVDFETYYSSIQDLQKAFQLQLNELLQKVKKEEDLESFHQELEKLGEKRKKDIDAFVEFAQRIQEEAKKTMPFFATYVGLGISIPICSLISYIISRLFKIKKRLASWLFLFFIYSLLQFFIFPLISYLLSLKISFFKETYKHYFANKIKLFYLLIIPIIIWMLMVIFGTYCICCKNKKDEDEFGNDEDVHLEQDNIQLDNEEYKKNNNDQDSDSPTLKIN